MNDEYFNNTVINNLNLLQVEIHNVTVNDNRINFNIVLNILNAESCCGVYNYSIMLDDGRIDPDAVDSIGDDTKDVLLWLLDLLASFYSDGNSCAYDIISALDYKELIDELNGLIIKTDAVVKDVKFVGSEIIKEPDLPLIKGAD